MLVKMLETAIQDVVSDARMTRTTGTWPVLPLGQREIGRPDFFAVGLMGCGYIFPDMPCVKRVYRDSKASVHWSAARNEERFSSR